MRYANLLACLSKWPAALHAKQCAPNWYKRRTTERNSVLSHGVLTCSKSTKRSLARRAWEREKINEILQWKVRQSTISLHFVLVTEESNILFKIVEMCNEEPADVFWDPIELSDYKHHTSGYVPKSANVIDWMLWHPSSYLNLKLIPNLLKVITTFKRYNRTSGCHAAC